MPTNRNSAGLINAAAPGFSRLALALGNGQAAYDDGADREVSRRTKLAQAAAAARLHDAQADETWSKTRVLNDRPSFGEEQAAFDAGVDVPQVRAIRELKLTGRAPQVPMGPPTEGGEMGVGSQQFDPQIVTKVGQALGRLAPMFLNTGDLNPEHMAKARALDRAGSLSDAIVAGHADRNRVAGAQAAVEGKPIYHSGDNGAVLDLFGGTLDTSSPMAGASIYERNQKGAQAKAGALENEAQARASAALAEQRRTITAAGKSGPGGKVPVGYRYTTGEDGEARLEPIPGGPKDPHAQTGKPLPASAAKGYLENQNSLRQVQKALSLLAGEKVGEIQGDKAATGWKGYAPDFILNRMDSAGNATRAAVADIGSLKIHDRSGAAVTAAETPRLKPFVPSATDPPDVVKTKLKLFEENYRAMVEDAAEFYKASGFNVPTLKERSDSPAGGFKYLGKE